MAAGNCPDCGIPQEGDSRCAACQRLQDDLKNVPDEIFMGMPTRYPWGTL